MREDEFRAWLAEGSINPKAGQARTYAVRTIEKNLAQLGSRDTDLDTAWKADRFVDLRQRLKDLQADFSSGGERFRTLMPLSAKPLNRLNTWRTALGQYGKFLSGEPRKGSLPDAVLQTFVNRLTRTEIDSAIAECGEEGTSAFLADRSFSIPRRWILREGTDARYPAKAIVAAAISYLPDGPDLTAQSFFNGFGEDRAFNRLEALGYTVSAPNLAEPDIIDRFRKNADFARAEAGWNEDQREAFIRLAEYVHDVGLDWWFVDIGHTPVRFGRKDKGNTKAHTVIGYLRAAEAHVNLNNRQDVVRMPAGNGFALDESAVNNFNAILTASPELLDRKLPTGAPRRGLWPDEIAMQTGTATLDPTPVWIVTARWGAEDGVQRFIDRGEWSLLTDTGTANNDRMRQMQPGDRMVMRDYFHQSLDLPFKANGARISAIRIRAMGTVTEQHGDGLSVGVDWEVPLPEPRVWYFYTQNDPIWWLKEPGESPLADRLRAFILHGAEQDYAYFLDQWFGTEHAQGQTSMPSPTNLILYGPPGTGKTYTTAQEAVRLCGEAVPDDRDELMALYRSLQHRGRIGFVTFHQNFAYEDFVEGLRPATGDGAEGSAGFSLNPEPGVFRRMADMAAKPVASSTAFSFDGRRIFKLSLGESGKATWNWVYEQSIEDGYALFGFRDVDWSDDRFSNREAILAELQSRFPDEKITSQTGIVKSPDRFRNQISIGDVVIISRGLNAFRAIGVVEGEYEYAPREGGSYCHRRKVRWLWEEPEGIPVGEISATRFSLDTVYELPRERLNLDVLARYVAGADEEAQDNGALLPHVLIIDEINRANISKVFGELITLLEPDKRLGMPNALTVRLPYSKTEFGVPANLHIIGTMNTADRSIALLDTALRRRFTFREMAPDPSLLETVEGIALPALLTAINDRIEYLVDREHRIGHAFFIHCKIRADVDAVMRDKVIPLLQEYFFEDWSRIAAVVGPGFIAKGNLKPPPGMKDHSDRPTWSVRPIFPADAYASLVGGVEVTAESAADDAVDEPQ